MRIALQCEKCKRPAPVISKRTGRTRFGHPTVNKTVAHTCECGGEIKPMID